MKKILALIDEQCRQAQIVVEDPALREALALTLKAFKDDQGWPLSEAPLLVALAADPHHRVKMACDDEDPVLLTAALYLQAFEGWIAARERGEALSFTLSKALTGSDVSALTSFPRALGGGDPFIPRLISQAAEQLRRLNRRRLDELTAGAAGQDEIAGMWGDSFEGWDHIEGHANEEGEAGHAPSVGKRATPRLYSEIEDCAEDYACAAHGGAQGAVSMFGKDRS